MLHMCISRHDDINIILSLAAQDLHQFAEQIAYAFSFLDAVHLGIKRDLIVTAPCRVQLLTGISDPLCEDCFYKHVDVFGSRIDRKSPGCYIIAYTCQPLNDRLSLFPGNDPLSGKHHRVSLAARNIPAVKPSVYRY